MKYLFLLLALGAVAAYKSYDGYQVIDVVPKNKAELKYLQSLTNGGQSIDFWKLPSGVGETVRMMLSAHQMVTYTTEMRRKGMQWLVVDANVGSLRVVSTTGDDKPGVYMDSLTHSREWLTTATTLYLMDNERLYRKNRNPSYCPSGNLGVDLNRNYDFKHGNTTSGATDDYSKGVCGVKYAYNPELRGPGFIISPSHIEPSFQEFWNGVKAMMTAIEANPPF
ncbi:hypothetical protein LSH36_567g00000 [Paralvinella palmiformis]|uniref:Carboxypeptidase activation peptide domain-containing protein n=1 Tax=Paralvinella palmiformis TaxID=53620 RepID=A0AAD9J785_9ANNE|nr:hypothetical protein LSH36_567g00000 [Paralvinella palmiformis]